MLIGRQDNHLSPYSLCLAGEAEHFHMLKWNVAEQWREEAKEGPGELFVFKNVCVCVRVFLFLFKSVCKMVINCVGRINLHIRWGVTIKRSEWEREKKTLSQMQFVLIFNYRVIFLLVLCVACEHRPYGKKWLVDFRSHSNKLLILRFWASRNPTWCKTSSRPFVALTFTGRRCGARGDNTGTVWFSLAAISWNYWRIKQTL